MVLSTIRAQLNLGPEYDTQYIPLQSIKRNQIFNVNQSKHRSYVTSRLNTQYYFSKQGTNHQGQEHKQVEL